MRFSCRIAAGLTIAVLAGQGCAEKMAVKYPLLDAGSVIKIALYSKKGQGGGANYLSREHPHEVGDSYSRNQRIMLEYVITGVNTNGADVRIQLNNMDGSNNVMETYDHIIRVRRDTETRVRVFEDITLVAEFQKPGR